MLKLKFQDTATVGVGDSHERETIRKRRRDNNREARAFSLREFTKDRYARLALKRAFYNVDERPIVRQVADRITKVISDGADQRKRAVY